MAAHQPFLPRRRRVAPRRGLSLLFSLLALAVLTLAAVALVRSVETGSLVMGNLGFKQDATATASQATESAIAWLQANAGTTLHNDVPASGYYATSRDALDVTGHASSAPTRALVDWAGDSCNGLDNFTTCVRASAELSLNGGQNRARWVITRLCRTEGDPAAVDCAFPLRAATSTGSNKGLVDYKTQTLTMPVSSLQYYRIVVRARSARNTVSFTETMIQL